MAGAELKLSRVKLTVTRRLRCCCLLFRSLFTLVVRRRLEAQQWLPLWAGEQLAAGSSPASPFSPALPRHEKKCTENFMRRSNNTLDSSEIVLPRDLSLISSVNAGDQHLRNFLLIWQKHKEEGAHSSYLHFFIVHRKV